MDVETECSSAVGNSDTRIALNLLTVQENEPVGVERFVRNVVGALRLPATCHVLVLLRQGVDAARALGAEFFVKNHKSRVEHYKISNTFTRIIVESLILSWRCWSQDVVLSANNFGPLFGKKSQRRILVVHDIWFLSNRYNSRASSSLAFSLLIRLHVRRAHHLVTVSQTSRAEIARILAIPEKQITVVPNCVERGTPGGDMAVEDNRFDYFLIMGSDRPNKNVRGAVAGFAEYLRASGSRARLYCVGRYKPEFARELVELASFAAGERLDIKGFVEEEELRRLIAGSIGVVYVSLYEGFGLPVIEAFAAGKPVMVSQGTVCEELAADAGVAVDGNSIESIAAGYSELENLDPAWVRSKARRIMERFSDCQRSGELLKSAILESRRTEKM